LRLPVSRTHERAYHLLAERVQLRTPVRRALYAVLTALVGSGVWWLGAHFAVALFGSDADDLHRLAREALALKVHGAAAFAILLALGAMAAHHVRRGWALDRNRASGTIVLACFAMLILTGYALYYLVGDDTRARISLAHWALGLALAPMLVVHVSLGRRGRGAATGGRHAHRHHPPRAHDAP
jgi:hypothetical protein